jgi:short-subunit dehydrogenase
MTERISLEGKVAVVTGAGRGLGRAYVEFSPNAVPGSW